MTSSSNFAAFVRMDADLNEEIDNVQGPQDLYRILVLRHHQSNWPWIGTQLSSLLPSTRGNGIKPHNLRSFSPQTQQSNSAAICAIEIYATSTSNVPSSSNRSLLSCFLFLFSDGSLYSFILSNPTMLNACCRSIFLDGHNLSQNHLDSVMVCALSFFPLVSSISLIRHCVCYCHGSEKEHRCSCTSKGGSAPILPRMGTQSHFCHTE